MGISKTTYTSKNIKGGWAPNFFFVSNKEYKVKNGKNKDGSDKYSLVSGAIVGTVLGYLWFKADDKEKIAFPSVPTIARHLGYSENSVKRALQVLMELEYIKKIGHKGKNDSWVAVYGILYWKIELAYKEWIAKEKAFTEDNAVQRKLQWSEYTSLDEEEGGSQ